MKAGLENNESETDEAGSGGGALSLVEHAQASIHKIENRELLNQLKNTIEMNLSEMAQTARVLADAKVSFERDSKLISESTLALERYWRQAHWYQGLIGMGVTLILVGGAFGIFYMRSTDRMLSQANVRLTSEPGSKGVRLTLSGDKVMASGRSDHQVVVEFSK